VRRLALAPLALLFLALTPSGTEARPAARTPVVFVVFDELPGDSLLDAPGHIDGARYPAFAALAGTSTWFPNAQSVFDATEAAVPAILDGRLPRRGTEPDTRDHPNNLFTLFARQGYRLRVREQSTRLCSRRLCPRMRRPGHDWPSPRRADRFDSFVASIRGSRPTLWFAHTLLPHVPWIFLPSGRRYRGSASEFYAGLSSPLGFNDPFLTRQSEQRYLLQLGFVDRLLGRLLWQLRRTGLYDRALIVVTADHGYSFDRHVKDRRKVTRRNIDEIAPVPLFIKTPHQQVPRVNGAFVRTVDILPTVARLLDWRLGWRLDGRNAFGRAVRRRDDVRMMARDFSGVVRIGRRAFARRRAQNIRRRLRWFGSGRESRYRIGPFPGLLGRPLAGLPILGRSGAMVQLEDEQDFRAVDLASPLLPVRVVGTVQGGRPDQVRDVVVAVNGVVAATGRTFHLVKGGAEYVSVFLPEPALRAGANEVELFEVLPGQGLLRLSQ
jgi:Sulfatase